MLDCVVYVRKSESIALTAEEQETICRKYAESSGLRIAKVYDDLPSSDTTALGGRKN